MSDGPSGRGSFMVYFAIFVFLVGAVGELSDYHGDCARDRIEVVPRL